MRESEKEILVLDSGDLLFKKYFRPVPEKDLKGVEEKARLMVESFNRMGYDALGIGDDELSLGKEFLLEISKKANFLFLSSNLLDEASGKPLFQPFIIKEIKGFRVGIFSLLSPDIFMNPADPRTKGATLQSPVETAQAMVNELKPKTDLIILLSHLGYPKDMELAQKVKGINIIVGSHTGMSLLSPAQINNTIILQAAPQGKLAGKIEFLFYNNEFIFYNGARKKELENELNQYTQQLKGKGMPKARRTELKRLKKDAEQALEQFRGKNNFNNSFVSLQENFKDDPGIKKMVDEYKAKFQPAGTPAPPKLSPTGTSRDISMKIPSYAKALACQRTRSASRLEGYPPVAKSAVAIRHNNTE